MQLRHRVSLGSSQLDAVDDRIVIHGVQTASAKTTINAVSLYGSNGQRITSSQRDTMDITVEFGILIRKTDMASRAEVLEAVNTWASAALKENGGAWLRVNYKNDRRIRVYLVDPAEEGDLKEWANSFKITFRAYGVPYWQESTGTSISTSTGSTRVASLDIHGNTRTVAEVEIKNESGQQIDTISITAGSSTMSFSSLALAANETLVIDHLADGLLRIRIRNTSNSYRSAMAKRAANSASDFYVMPGTQTISFTAQRTCSMTARAYGRFL